MNLPLNDNAVWLDYTWSDEFIFYTFKYTGFKYALNMLMLHFVVLTHLKIYYLSKNILLIDFIIFFIMFHR